MTLMKWRPTAHPSRWLNDLSREFDRIFDGDFFGRDSLIGRTESSLLAAVDIFETESEVVVKAELPGIEEKNVDVTIEDGILTIKGEKKEETQVKEGEIFRSERSYGTFQRRFLLPKSANAEKAEANFKSGVLDIHIPKREEAKPKKITVKAG